MNSEEIQKHLVDPLRKGQTILPAIECYNSIEEHLLVITHIEHAGKVLLDFLKNPKKFTFCRYPLLLCCLVCEFMIKLKRRFAVYESFFDQIFKGFESAGKSFASKIKDSSVLEYHLNRRDLKNRTCLQIMSQNRLYKILFVDNIGAIIGKYWGGNFVQYGLLDMSSFSYIFRYNVDDKMYKFEDFAKSYNEQKHFFFNYYSYRDTVSIRYYFKELYTVVLVTLYMILIYFAVIDTELDYTIMSKDVEATITDASKLTTLKNKYYLLTRLTYLGSLVLAINKINSMIFFGFVNRWYIEIDSLFLELIFFVAVLFHWWNFKKWFLDPTDKYSNELADAILLSIQIAFLWWKVIDSLKATKIYGGFLRTVFISVKKLFLLVCFFYCFIIVCTGVFNLLFQQYTQFQNYFDSFFYLCQAALQQYTLDPSWTIFLNFSLMVVMGICTLILTNLIIALATKIYNDIDDNIEPEHRGNLITIYEYLNWDENYGIFKFLHAPFNLIQLPFSIFILFSDNKKYWTEIFCKILYFFIACSYFLALIVINLIRAPFVYLHLVLIHPYRYGSYFKKTIIGLLFGLFFISYYFILDLIKFWNLAYRKQFKMDNGKDKTAAKILEFKKLFSNLIADISERVDSDKRLKKFSIVDLVSGWLIRMSTKSGGLVTQDEINRMHKRSLIIKKYRNSSIAVGDYNRSSHASIFKTVNSKISIFEHFTNILYFLTKFADNEGFIDKELARNIFPKRNYYDNEFFEFLFYFKFKYFRTLLAKFTKNTGQVRREMNKLRGVLNDIKKIHEKFGDLKFKLKNIPSKNMSVLSNGINSINTIFAVLENNLLDAQTKELFRKIMIGTTSAANKGKHSSTYQKDDMNNNLINRLQDLTDK